MDGTSIRSRHAPEEDVVRVSNRAEKIPMRRAGSGPEGPRLPASKEIHHASRRHVN